MSSVSKSWCFTLNNYDETELDSLRKSLQEKASYAIFGFEVGESGTPHLQGFATFKKALRLTGVKKLVGIRAHVEVAKASASKNREYCSKQGKIEEFGCQGGQQGARSDLYAFKEAVDAGLIDSRKRAREEFPEVVAKYHRYCYDYINDHKPRAIFKKHEEFYEWQVEMNNILNRPPDDREVIFIVDEQGNSGKTYFAKYYCSLHESAFYMRPTKHADMAYALPDNLRVLFLDCTRTQLDHLPYSFLESVKDGMVMSSKYESCMKTYGPVHVVVLMNQMPDMNALSVDRYSIRLLRDNKF